jgi:antitoxin component of RelBE/YafQ-DinJ toxin-antitoxin module
MNAVSHLTIPMDTSLKTKVKLILKKLGLNQSQVINAFFLEIERTNSVPLSFDLKDSITFTDGEWVELEQAKLDKRNNKIIDIKKDRQAINRYINAL